MDENAQASTQADTPGIATGGNPPTKSYSLYRPTIVAILYLLNFFLGFSVIVGVVLAYVWRGERETQEWERTHFTYLIRTFWIGLLFMFVLFVVWFGMVFGTAFAEIAGAGTHHGGAGVPVAMLTGMFGGMFLFLATAGWYAARCILSLVKAGDSEPMPRPDTWWF